MSGLLTQMRDGQVKQNILIDAGLGTIEGLADSCEDSFWDEPLIVLITHGHIDHHAELMILAEIYCTRRGQSIDDVRPPLPVYCTVETQEHLFNTHRYGYTAGNTLRHCAIKPLSPFAIGDFRTTPIPVDHFEGSVLFTIEFGQKQTHKILIGWDMRTLPWEYMENLQRPSLAMLEATTWDSLTAEIGHTNIEDMVRSGFIEALGLRHLPGQELFGAYLVHYSGWEDATGAMTDKGLKDRFDTEFPQLADVVRVAERGQTWRFTD